MSLSPVPFSNVVLDYSLLLLLWYMGDLSHRPTSSDAIIRHEVVLAREIFAERN
jgi:hypothetical protein